MLLNASAPALSEPTPMESDASLSIGWVLASSRSQPTAVVCPRLAEAAALGDLRAQTGRTSTRYGAGALARLLQGWRR